MAKDNAVEKKDGEVCDQSNLAMKLYQDLNEIITTKYPNISVDAVEWAVSLVVAEVSVNTSKIAPENETEPIERTIDKLLYISQGANNSFLRLCSKVATILSGLKVKMEKCDGKDCDCGKGKGKA